MTAARLFRNGQSQAVRIPKSMEFVGIDEVEIERVADTIVLRPSRKDWLSFADEIDKADDDFMRERPELLDRPPVDFEQ